MWICLLYVYTCLVLGSVFFQKFDDSVPESNPSLKSLLSSSSGLFPARVIIVSTKLSHHHHGHWSVILAIDFDVSLQIDDEVIESAFHSLVHVTKETSEHERDQIFTTEGKGGCHNVQLAGPDELKSGSNKAGGRSGGFLQGFLQSSVRNISFGRNATQDFFYSIGSGTSSRLK